MSHKQLQIQKPTDPLRTRLKDFIRKTANVTDHKFCLQSRTSLQWYTIFTMEAVLGVYSSFCIIHHQLCLVVVHVQSELYDRYLTPQSLSCDTNVPIGMMCIEVNIMTLIVL